MKIQVAVDQRVLNCSFTILNYLLRFTHTNVEPLRAESIEREADNAVDQAILFIQQRRWEYSAVAWRHELDWP